MVRDGYTYYHEATIFCDEATIAPHGGAKYMPPVIEHRFTFIECGVRV